jgi:hypothetical protein
MNEKFLNELFIECYTIQDLQRMYFNKSNKNKSDPIPMQISLDLIEIFKEKYDALLDELTKVDGTISKKVDSSNERIDGEALFHINMKDKSIRSMKSFGIKAIYRELFW